MKTGGNNVNEEPTTPLPSYPDRLLTDAEGTQYDPPIVFGKFQIVQLVRRNVQTSIVCRGKRPKGSTELAIKICGPQADNDRFKREIDYTRKIHDSGVVGIDERDVGQTQCGRWYFGSDWSKGPTLDQFLADSNQEIESKLNAVESVCQTLASLHQQGYSHRDIKPSNVIVTGIHGHGTVLLDLGLAHLKDSPNRDPTLTGQHPGGTSGRFPPWTLDAKTRRHGTEFQWDVYALGVLLVEALTGMSPSGNGDPRFSPESMRKTLARSPKTLPYQDLVCVCLASDPRQAPKDAGAVLKKLRACRGVSSRSVNIWRPTLAALLLLAVVFAWVQRDELSAYAAKLNGKTPALAETPVDEALPPAEVEQIPDPRLIENPSGTNQVIQLTVNPPGATVRLVNHREGGVVLYEKKVPNTGQLTLEIPDIPGADLGLIAFHTGYQAVSQSIRLGGPDALTLSLDRLRGEVEFKSNPGGEVTLKDRAGATRRFGPIPTTGALLIRSLEEGDWGWRLDLADHHSATGLVSGLTQGRRQTVQKQLEPMPGRVSITGHHATEVWLGERRLGLANDWLPLPAGNHTLELRRNSFRRERLEIDLPPNRDITRAAPEMVAEAGGIQFIAEVPEAAKEFFKQSRARLKVDGREETVGSWPHTASGLGVGAHRVQLEASGFEPVEMPSVTVRDQQTEAVSLTLKPLPAKLTVSGEPATAEVYSSTGERMGRMGEVVSVPAFTEGYVEVRASGYTTGSITFKVLNPEGNYSGKINLARQTLPADLIAMNDAGPAPLAGLYDGSREAQERQIAEAKRRGLPLQVQTKSYGIEMRFVPSGSYRRGSPANEAGRDGDEGQHTVVLTNAFWVSRFPVRQRDWQAVMGSNPSFFTASGLDAPVENVSHDQSQEFLNKLSDVLGVPRGTYRLLTEAEWEYACRAGTTGGYYGPLDDIAWYDTNSGNKTHPVGGKKPNAYGLFDMSGNVWEWCADWYGTYPTGTVTDLAGPGSGSGRVLRGGSYRGSARLARSANRHGRTPGITNGYLGLRLARTVE